MEPADIDAARECLQPRRLRRSDVPWTEIRHVRSTRLASLADEIGLILQDDHDGAWYVRETAPGFAALSARLGLQEAWGNDWMARTESGTEFALRLEAKY
jgi:hypothetical protein